MSEGCIKKDTMKVKEWPQETGVCTSERQGFQELPLVKRCYGDVICAEAERRGKESEREGRVGLSHTCR